jgi:hypothetical protein
MFFPVIFVHFVTSVDLVGWAHEATLIRWPFLMYCASPYDLLIISNLCTIAVWHLPADTSRSELGKLGEEMAYEFCLRNICFIFVMFFNMQQHLTAWDRRLYFHLKEVVLLILTPLKVHRPLSGLNPRALGLMANMLPLDHRGRPYGVRLWNSLRKWNIY